MLLAHGIYEALLDQALQEALAKRPELRRVFGKIDPEGQPPLYASFVAKGAGTGTEGGDWPGTTVRTLQPSLAWCQTGVGVMHFAEQKTYVLLVAFQKTEEEFSPSTMYANYSISRDLLYWESQANTAQHHTDGQNLIHLHGSGLCPWAEEAEQRDRAV